VHPAARVHSLLLVRNGVDHDARVLRAARVAERALGGTALVIGVATTTASAGRSTVEGVPVLRLPARMPHRAWLPRMPRATWRRRMPHPAWLRRKPAQRPRGPEAVSDAASQPVARLALPARARRVLSGLSFALQTLLTARRLRPRLIHANDWNTMWSGTAIKLAYGGRLVYDSHELWADRNGRWEWRPWLLASEALFVRIADEVVASSPGHAEALAVRYRTRRPAVVRNIPENRRSDPARPADPMSRSDRSPAPASRAPALPWGRPAPDSPRSLAPVVYVGGLMPGRGLEQMIDSLALLPDLCLRAIGAGTESYRASLLARATARGVADRVELCAPVPPAEVTRAVAGAVAGLCLIQPICRSYELCLPNKLFEYAAAGVPILASDVPVIAAVVRGEGIGEVVPSQDPEAIAGALRRLREHGRWSAAVDRARAFARTNDWAGEAQTLAEVYTGASAPRTAQVGEVTVRCA
jgi:glycosyltransferase involved in cell wall biosynthesis